MKTYSEILLAGAFCLAALGVIACSDDGSYSSVTKDEKKGADFVWNDVHIFDAMVDLPSCSEFREIVQVNDEKAFYECIEKEWEKIRVSAPSYDRLPECNAAMNGFSIVIAKELGVFASYECDEGEWVSEKRENGNVDECGTGGHCDDGYYYCEGKCIKVETILN